MGGIREPIQADRGRHNTAASSMLWSDVDWENEQETIAFLQTAFNEVRRSKAELERNWHQNIQFYMGNHYLSFRRGRWVNAARLSHRVRYKANMVRQYVQTRSAVYIKDDPILKALPATGQPSDAEKAVNSTRALRSTFDRLKVKKHVYPDFLFDTFVMGTGCLKAFWDADDGFDIGAVEGEARTGDVGVDAVSPFYIYVDPAGESFEDAMWIFDARRVSLDRIRARWPEKGREVEAVNISPGDQTEFYRDVIRGYSGYNSQSTSHNQDQTRTEEAMVLEFWMRPSTINPQGRRVVMVGDTIMENDTLPDWLESNGKYFWPFIFLLDGKIRHRIWGSPITDDLRDVNKVRNRAVSLIIENSNLIGSPPILNPKGSKLKSSQFTGKPGAIWTYVPTATGDTPKFLDVPSLPAYVSNLPQMLESDGQMITGINEAMGRGQAPENVRTSSGLASLLKQDESRQAVNLQMFSASLSELGSVLLVIMSNMYTEERLFKISGEHGYSSFLMTGKDLIGENVTPGVNYFDVEITVEAGHNSKEAFRQFITNLAQMGLFNMEDEDERREVMRMLDVGQADDSVFSETRLVAAQAVQENIWMSELEDDAFREKVGDGLMIVHDWDDHEAHVVEHLKFMRRADFLDLSEDLRARFQMHQEQHVIAVTEAEAANAPPGAGAAAGAAGADPAQGQGAPAGPSAPEPGGPQAPGPPQGRQSLPGQGEAMGPASPANVPQ